MVFDATRASPLDIGFVIIGRNEGERLQKSIDSIIRPGRRVVYVDSGSMDGSAELARSKGAVVLELDNKKPFTAARARNEGFQRLRELDPALRYVQFVDGDCELVEGWVEKAVDFLRRHPDIAVVCGRLRERQPERSIYNMICDCEWDAPAGETEACGGNALIVADAFLRASGYRVGLVAGEEPELCYRLRAAGWRIWRLQTSMAYHDAAMMRFSQWWKRSMRSGYGFAEGALLHPGMPERMWIREIRSGWIWAAGVPLATWVFTAMVGPSGWVILLIYPLQVARLALRGRRSMRQNWWCALFTVLGKFPEILGQAKFLMNRLVGKRAMAVSCK